MKNFIKMITENTKDQIAVVKNHLNLRRERHEKILYELLENNKIEGNILEVGAYTGESTQIYLKYAKTYNRHVIVVDPWDGKQEGNSSVYNIFLQNVLNKVDIPERLLIHRLCSDDPKIPQLLLQEKFAFVFLDGLHTYKAIKSDIALVLNKITKGGIICIDDIRGLYPFNLEIMQAFQEFNDPGFEKILTPKNIQEGYLLKC